MTSRKPSNLYSARQMSTTRFRMSSCRSIGVTASTSRKRPAAESRSRYFRLPEYHVILHRYAIVTQDINLLGNLLSSQKACLEFVHFRCPFAINALRYIFFKLGIFDILGIRIYRVHGRITFLVRTVLLQRIEATRHLLCIFRHRFLQVTAGRDTVPMNVMEPTSPLFKYT